MARAVLSHSSSPLIGIRLNAEWACARPTPVGRATNTGSYTADVYAHLTPAMLDGAAEQMDAILAG